MGYQKMYLEIECIGKCLGSLRGGEREPWGVCVTVELSSLQCLENAPVDVVIRKRAKSQCMMNHGGGGHC